MLNELKKLMLLGYWLKKGRHDHDEKLKRSAWSWWEAQVMFVYFIFALQYRYVLSRRMLIAVPRECSPRELTLAKFKLTGMTGLVLTGAMASFWERGIYTPWLHPCVGANAIPFRTSFRALWALVKSSQTYLCKSCLILVESFSWVEWDHSLRAFEQERNIPSLSTCGCVGQLNWSICYSWKWSLLDC